MYITELQMLQTVEGFMLPFFRIAAMLMSMTIFGTRLVPTRIRILLAFMMTMLVFPHLPVVPQSNLLSFSMMILVAKEVTLGVALGFTMQLVFQAFIIGGQLIAMQGGLGFASMMDPQNAVSVPSVSQFYLMFVTLLFLSLDGHLMMFEMLVNSFSVIPVYEPYVSLNGIWQLVLGGGAMFKTAIGMSIPALIALLAVNVAFGVMTKASPQLNIFTVGFPITITLTVTLMLVTLPLVLEHFKSLYEYGGDLMWIIISSR